MATPMTKRRKLDSAAALKRPFKSPLRSDLQKSQGSINDPITKADLDIAIDNSRLTLGACSPITKPENSEENTTTRIPNRTPGGYATSASIGNLQSIPSLRALQRTLTQLLMDLTTQRAALDTATQALKLTCLGRDAELQRLIMVWRSASQTAVEELFASAKDRVNGMGGLGAWRDRERERGKGWSDEGGNGQFDEAKRGEGEMRDEDESEYGNDGGNVDEVTDQSGTGDEAFTIDMMLQSLKIDLKIVGYDKNTQQWIN